MQATMIRSGLPASEATGALLRMTLASMLQQAQGTALPPFARTLGLLAGELRDVADYCDSAMNGDVVPGDHPSLLSETPSLVHQLAALMMENRSPEADETHARWLAHAIACASFGRRHLWEDLGVKGRDVVSALLSLYFKPLYLRNVFNLKWKRFLFDELAAALGQGELRAPGCAHCDQHQHCYPPVNSTRN